MGLMSISKPILKEDLEFLRETFEYDPITGIVFNRPFKQAVGSVSRQGYLRTSAALPSGRRILGVHNIAWCLHHGEWPVFEVDHRDQNKTNNKADNLRKSTRQLNQANQRKHRGYRNTPCSSQYKGVVWHKRDKRWQATIQVNGCIIGLGCYTNEEDAALAYNRAAKEMFGEFAVINEVP